MGITGQAADEYPERITGRPVESLEPLRPHEVHVAQDQDCRQGIGIPAALNPRAFKLKEQGRVDQLATAVNLLEQLIELAGVEESTVTDRGKQELAREHRAQIRDPLQLPRRMEVVGQPGRRITRINLP
ncbi:MAG: hypothetical protein U5L11_16475 [Arhodomonas sp.]|nr:hypothetical protein [Arhodomonas sp.]